MKRKFQAKVEIKRRYGDHEITFGLSEEIEADSIGGVQENLLRIQSLLENQVTVYEKVSLPHVRLPHQTSTTQGDNGSSENFLLDTITVDSQGGKKIIKAKGGQFTKHGVPVYPECATDLPLETLPFGVHDFRHLNLTVKCDLVDGKPKRAVSIR